MLFSFFIALFASTAVFAEITGHSNKKVKACTRELEGIVYTPANCANNYLQRITNTLRVKAEFWTNPIEAASDFKTFENTFGVSAIAISPFGKTYISADTFSDSNMGHSIARANLDGDGFTNTGANYIYTTIIRPRDAQMFYFQVTLAKANAPLVC
jgi:hypothetical protein